MTMLISVKINDDAPLVRLKITNNGPPHPGFKGLPGEDDLTHYLVRSVKLVDNEWTESEVVCDVYHKRADGPTALAGKVLLTYSRVMRELGADT